MLHYYSVRCSAEGELLLNEGHSYLKERKTVTSVYINTNQHSTAPRSTYHLNAEDFSSLVGGDKGYVFIFINKMLLRNILFPEHLAS